MQKGFINIIIIIAIAVVIGGAGYFVLNKDVEVLEEVANEVQDKITAEDETVDRDTILPFNKISVHEIQEGDKIADFIVKKIVHIYTDPKFPDFTSFVVDFSGETTVSGEYDTRPGHSCDVWFSVDDSDTDKIPRLKEDSRRSVGFCIRNEEFAKNTLSAKQGKATIVIKDYTEFHREMGGGDSADLVKVIIDES